MLSIFWIEQNNKQLQTNNEPEVELKRNKELANLKSAWKVTLQNWDLRSPCTKYWTLLEWTQKAHRTNAVHRPKLSKFHRQLKIERDIKENKWTLLCSAQLFVIGKYDDCLLSNFDIWMWFSPKMWDIFNNLFSLSFTSPKAT